MSQKPHLTDYMTSLVNQMIQMRAAGRTWIHIAGEMGYGSAHSARSTYSRERRRRRLLAAAPTSGGDCG